MAMVRSGWAWHSSKTELSFDGEINTEGSVPTASLVGSTITITDTEFAGSYYLNSVTNTKTKAGWMTFSGTATLYPQTLVTTA